MGHLQGLCEVPGGDTLEDRRIDGSLQRNLSRSVKTHFSASKDHFGPKKAFPTCEPRGRAGLTPASVSAE